MVSPLVISIRNDGREGCTPAFVDADEKWAIGWLLPRLCIAIWCDKVCACRIFSMQGEKPIFQVTVTQCSHAWKMDLSTGTQVDDHDHPWEMRRYPFGDKCIIYGGSRGQSPWRPAPRWREGGINELDTTNRSARTLADSGESIWGCFQYTG